MDEEDMFKCLDELNKGEKDKKMVEVFPLIKHVINDCINFTRRLKDNESKDIFIYSMYASLLCNRCKSIDEIYHVNKRIQSFLDGQLKSMDKIINTGDEK